KEWFQRRTEYTNNKFIVKIRTTHTITDTVIYKVVGSNKACEDFAKIDSIKIKEGEEVYYNKIITTPIACNNKSGLIGFTIVRVVKAEQKKINNYSTYYTLPFNWPNAEYYKAAQNFRKPLKPELNFETVRSEKSILVCNNLNTDTTDTIREQVSGKLKVWWEPGSYCAESTLVEKSFGNIYTHLDSNWLVMMPRFENAISTTVGIWRDSKEVPNVGNRHQWLDRFDIEKKPLGGGFFPDFGDSITKREATTIWAGNLPSITVAFEISKELASKDSSISQSYKLWFLPGGYNGVTSRYVYWNIDAPLYVDTSKTVDLYTYDSLNIQWIPGPVVWLDSGKHTLTLFMKDDGVKIAGIAMSKLNEAPPYDINTIPSWGTKGYNITVEAEGLQPGREIKFFALAEDRFGNKSELCSLSINIPSSGEKLPLLVITPQKPLNNGFYSSIYPSFTVTTKDQTQQELGLQFILRKIVNGIATDISNKFYSIETQKNRWQVYTDTTSPLEVFPIGAVTEENSYILLVRARSISSTGDTSYGSWTRLKFGVVADSNEIPPNVVIDNIYYIIPDLKFKFINGTELSGNTIIGNLQLVFDEDSGYSKKQLVLENAIITTDTATVNGVKRHRFITSIRGGSFNVYNVSDDGKLISRTSEYELPFGKHKIIIPATPENLFLDTLGGVVRLRVFGAKIIDDFENRCKISANQDVEDVPLFLTRYGLRGTFYVPKDYFIVKNAVVHNPVEPGFDIVSCKTTFIRPPAGGIDSFTIITAGSCINCGPFLSFTAKNPFYKSEEFSTKSEKLEKPVIVSYVNPEQKYKISFPNDTINNILLDKLKEIKYAGWRIKINSAYFNERGITITDANIAVDPYTFSIDTTNNWINGFKKLRIFCDPLADGILHLGENGISNSPVKLTTFNYYIIKANSAVFQETSDKSGYHIVLKKNDTLLLPSWREPATTIYRENDTIKVLIDSCKIGYNDIASFGAKGRFERTIGSKKGSNETTGLRIKGDILVDYKARDFQIALKSGTNDTALLSLPEGFILKPFPFNPLDTCISSNGMIYLKKSSIGLFSDLSINTLYARKNFCRAVKVSPNGFNNFWGIEGIGFDVIKTKKDVHIFLLSPQIEVPFGAAQNTQNNESKFNLNIYNAIFDCDKNLVAISGNVTLPEDKRNLSNIKQLKEFAEKYLDGELVEIYFSYNREQGDGTKLSIGASSILTLGSKFRKIGMDGEKIFIDSLTFSYHFQNNNVNEGEWTFDRFTGRAFTIPKTFIISKGSFSGKDDEKKVEYIKIANAGEGMKVDYIGADAKILTLSMNNWALSICDSFPLKELSGLTFYLDELEVEKDFKDTTKFAKITKLRSETEYVIKNNKIGLDNFAIVGKNGGSRNDSLIVKLGYDNSRDTGSGGGYFEISFYGIKVGDSIYTLDCSENQNAKLRVYFDGDVFFEGCLTFKDTIPLYPILVKPSEAEYFIQPPPQGISVEVKIERKENKFSLTLGSTNVNFSSKNKVPLLGEKLDARGNFSAEITEKGIMVKEALATLILNNKELAKCGPLSVSWNELTIGFVHKDNSEGIQSLISSVPVFANKIEEINNNKSNIFYIYSKFSASLKGSNNIPCQLSVSPVAGIFVSANPSEKTELKFAFGMENDEPFDCNLAGFKFGGNLLFSEDKIGFSYAYLDMTKLKDFGLVEPKKEQLEKELEDTLSKLKEQNKIEIKRPNNVPFGVEVFNCVWTKTADKWELNKKEIKVVAHFDLDAGFDVLGVKVKGTFDFGSLFSDNPRLVYKNISIALSKRLGGIETPVPLSMYLDLKPPYLHPEPDKPQVVRLAIPEIKLTEQLKLGTALMEFGAAKDPISEQSTWYFRGKATMSLGPTIDELAVDV
ncbi:MAG: hypothetical protein N2053_05250, partial [Chitinispirillaceae bacterium]|nr:hypothetical protein [Chitinispirillaceae bacterium]